MALDLAALALPGRFRLARRVGVPLATARGAGPAGTPAAARSARAPQWLS